jgi:hypothetical protein
VKSIEQDYMLTLKPDLSILKGKPGFGGGGSTSRNYNPWNYRVGGAHDGALWKTALDYRHRKF